MGEPKGGFVEIVRAIDKIYLDGEIHISQFPFARSLKNVSKGRWDFHIPYIRPPHVNEKNLGFTYADECITKVTFVLYSRNTGKDLNINTLNSLKIDTLRGHKNLMPFHVSETNDIETGIKKILARRIHGFVMEQDAVDKYLRENKIKGIHRQLYAEWDSCIVIPKTEKGKRINEYLSSAIRQLKASGDLDKINKTIHKPYDNWQPINAKY